MSRRVIHKRDINRKVVLQERDLKILETLYYYRLLTTSQIKELFFDSLKTAQTRMRKLYDIKLVSRIFRPTVFDNVDTIYILANKAIDIVSKETGIETGKILQVIKNGQRRTEFDHFLEMNNFRISLNISATEYNNTISELAKAGVKPEDIIKNEIFNWHYDDELRTVKGFRLVSEHVPDPEISGQTLTLAPDAFFGITSSKGKFLRYLEIDRGTMSNKAFYEKFKAYMSYVLSGGFKKKWEQFGYERFKVLIVSPPINTPGKKDIKDRISLADKIDARFKGMFMFTENTFITPKKILGQIWVSPDNLTFRCLHE